MVTRAKLHSNVYGFFSGDPTHRITIKDIRYRRDIRVRVHVEVQVFVKSVESGPQLIFDSTAGNKVAKGMLML